MFTEKPESQFEGSGQENDFDPEDELLEKLESSGLPEEIKNRIENEFLEGEKTAEQALEKIKHILEKRRQQAAEFPELPTQEGVYNEYIKQEQAKTREKLRIITQEALENKMESIGAGTTAKIVISSQDDNFCYKVITSIDNYRKGNDVKQETEYLDKLTSITGTHTRVPKPYSYEMNKSGHLYIMERLNAASLQEIFDNVQQLPSGFNSQEFFDDLEEFIHKMHQKGLYHRDLSNPGNIMVDKNTGMPYIIDFGTSTKSIGSSGDPYREAGPRGEMVAYADDLESIKKHKKAIQNIFKV
jgi:serine/threonine protein kinase